MATTYDKNTDFANQETYLKNLLGSSNKGEASWANSELSNLYSAADKIAKDTAAGVGAGSVGVDASYLFGNGTGYSPSAGSGAGAANGGSVATYSPSSADLINSAYKSSLNAQERQLKSALEEALADMEVQKKSVSDYYKGARSDTYADQMVANKNSNEAMLAQGINSGAIAQASLSSNNALQGNLGQLNANEASALGEIAANKAKLQNAYQDDVTALQSSLEADKLNALLNDYYNQQDYGYQKSRDAVADQQYADSLAYQNKQDKEEWAWNMWQKLGYATQEIANTLGIPKGMPFSTVSTASKAQRKTVNSGNSGDYGDDDPNNPFALDDAQGGSGSSAIGNLSALESFILTAPSVKRKGEILSDAYANGYIDDAQLISLAKKYGVTISQ